MSERDREASAEIEQRQREEYNAAMNASDEAFVEWAKKQAASPQADGDPGVEDGH